MNKEEIDQLIMLNFGAFTRRICNNWINPAKSRGYYEDLRRVFYKDESPEGLYPSCVVPETLVNRIVVIIPINHFKTLLEAWKIQNPERMKSIVEILKRREGTP